MPATGGRLGAVVLIAIVAAVSGTAIGALGATGEDSFLQERAAVQSYDTLRFGVQHDALGFATTTPLGIGPGQFEYDFVAYPHNVYILVAAEQGVLGALASSHSSSALLLAVRNCFGAATRTESGRPHCSGRGGPARERAVR